MKCYKCEGRGHLARECRTRLEREKNSQAQPSSRKPSERSERNTDYPHEKRRASSFFLSAPETAADYHTESLRLRQNKPTVRVKIRGVNREFIVDSGSGVSIIKPGICHGQVITSCTHSFGMTGDELGIRGEKDVQLCLENWDYRHTFCVCHIPTNADGILGMDFLSEMNASLDIEKRVFGCRNVKYEDAVHAETTVITAM